MKTRSVVIQYSGDQVLQLNIQTTPSIHFDPENSINFANAAANILAALCDNRCNKPIRSLDLGCGCGI